MTSRLKLFGDYVYLPNTNSFAGSKTHALKVAWPGIIRDIEDDAISGIREDLDNLQYDFDQLQKQLDEA